MLRHIDSRIGWRINIFQKKMSKCRVTNGIRSQADLFSRIREIVEQGLGQLFITILGTFGRSHVFNEPDLEQYLFDI